MGSRTADLYLKNARVVTEDDDFPGGLLIEGEKIRQVIQGTPSIPVNKEIDLGGNLLMPGLVDSHVHFNEPGRAHWEGYQTGSMAAAAGGVTTFLEMPLNSKPETLSAQDLEEKRQTVASQPVVDYGQWGGLVDNNLEDLESLHEGGVIGLKAFLSDSGIENFQRIDDDLLYAGLQETKRLGNVLALHAENEYVTRYLGGEMRRDGRKDRASWTESRPPFAELEAINRAIYWARITEGNLHFVHVTIPEGLQAVAQAKGDGVRVTAETCPHYLYFDREDFTEIGPKAKCAPPLRSSEIVNELWQYVLAGKVDTIGSDHSPCTWEEKATGMDDIWQAWGGISGVQTMLSVILTEGFHKRDLPLTAVARMMSSNPARIFGLYPQKGSLQPGSDADVTVIDLDQEWTVNSEDLFYKNKFSAFEGANLTGKVTHTFVRGRLVYREGSFASSPGYGKLLKRQYSPEETPTE
mgnify:CR=1 FL=1